MTETKDVIKKICLLGDPAVGKTSLIRKYVYDMFDDKYITTIGTKVTKKQVIVKDLGPDKSDVRITLLIWDILGQREYQRLHPVYYQGAEGALIVCDGTRMETMNSLESWATSFKNVVGDVPIVFLINKSDLINLDEVDITPVEEVSKSHNAPFMPTSAKLGTNVENAFYTLSKLIAKKAI